MKETVYRCNRCHKLINGTVHRIGATDEKGEQTRYGALFDDTDLCDRCMEEVTLAAIAEIDHPQVQNVTAREWKQSVEAEEQKNEPAGQQDQKEETPEILNAEPVTYKCSEVIKTCTYAENAGAAMICNYIGIEGHRRGCDPEACDKYKKIERKRGRKPKKEQENMPEIVEG